jgi:hypothetical protein
VINVTEKQLTLRENLVPLAFVVLRSLSTFAKDPKASKGASTKY